MFSEYGAMTREHLFLDLLILQLREESVKFEEESERPKWTHVEIKRVTAETTKLLDNYRIEVKDELTANGNYLKESLAELKRLDGETLELVREEDIKKNILESGKFALRHRIVVTKVDLKIRENLQATGNNSPAAKQRTIKLPYLQLKKVWRKHHRMGSILGSFFIIYR